MAGWKTYAVGAGFFVAAIVNLLKGGSPWTIGILLTASAFIIYRAFRGLSSGGSADFDLAINFVRNPTGTVINETFNRLTADGDATRSDAPSRHPLDRIASALGFDEEDASVARPFDPDAAVARYLSARAPSDSPPAPGFGRKGL